ncbi:MAG TPA: hypothetical protein VFT55_16710, partial [Planctomycetota bacterium]|nr:hypothetical protein [Planctomycetota bacterium]
MATIRAAVAAIPLAAFVMSFAVARPQEPAPAAPKPPPAAASQVSSLFAGRAARREQCKDARLVEAVRAGVGWLLAHQDANGQWDCEQFFKHDPKDDQCTGSGGRQYDIGITALALLAVLAQADPLHAEPAHKAADWLTHSLDRDGRVSSPLVDFMYLHVLATLALVEMSALFGNERHRAAANAALRYVDRHRNLYGAWRYKPNDNDNDTSLTAWCLAANAEALHAGFKVPADSCGTALAWLDGVTDFMSGHAGYQTRGEPSARLPGDHVERFPKDRTHAMTAAALHCRLLMGLAPDSKLALAAAELQLQIPPSLQPPDLYYWFHASSAAALMPSCPASRKWEAAVQKALLASQGKDKSRKGSWDPIDVWGQVGGRVQTTAFAVLALSSPWRLERLDARAQVIDQVPLRKLFALVGAGKVGEATAELDRFPPAALPPASVPGLERL